MRVVHCLYILAFFCLFLSEARANSVDPSQLTLYQVLNLPQDATKQQISAAQISLAKKYAAIQTADARRWMLAVQKAYQVLSDPESRMIYDFQLSESRSHARRSEKYNTQTMLEEIVRFMQTRGYQLTNETLVGLQTFLLSKIGDPKFMIHPRQRQVFYNDLMDLLQKSENSGASARTLRATLIVILDLLIKYQDPMGIERLDQLYVKWGEFIRLATPGQNTFHFEERMHFIEVLEAKYHRRVPTPSADICVGHLVDKRV